MKNNLIKNELGFFGVIAFFLLALAVIGLVYPLVRLIFCAILDLDCIDAETGKSISIPWLGIIIIIGFSIVLLAIDQLYHTFKKK
ncbi:hypothetical protein EON73_03585 [bacterium]|nr:MAG: hypothetical protein EON73_03585 [bacterium]